MDRDREIEVPERPRLEVLLAAPRSFCAGVERAIRIVELALEKYGAPVYVRHEIVHNRHVVDSLRARGAVFVDELDECPDDRPVVLSAHGVPTQVIEEARARNLFFVDATCPLVTKVHLEVRRHHKEGREVVLIGHAGHPETVGTIGQIPEDGTMLVETVEDVAKLRPRDPEQLAFATQTTLAVDDTAGIVSALRERFPEVAGPHGEDICYASTNRQVAVKEIAGRVDAFFVIGAPNSSNSQRLVSAARKAGCRRATLIERAVDIDWAVLEGCRTVGVTASASAPESLIDELIEAFRARYEVRLEEVRTAVENLRFRLPAAVREEGAAA